MDEFIRGLQEGRPEAFERLVRQYGDRIYRFVKRLAGERPAEDLTQEVLLRVHRSIESYRPEGRFESWLFAIANNLCIDQARRRQPEVPMSELGGDLGPDRFASISREPLESMEDEERRRAILAAVDRLPFEQRQVFLLREEASLSFREIAELTGCPLNTALGRMHYAMEALRRSLKAYGVQ
jgi:RNA polymerase sigma-70 factor (ECF subfamily)